jgi:hypothetical protein
MATAGVGGLPSFTGMVPGQFPDPAKSVAAIGPQNPSQASPDDGPFSLNGVIEEDKKLLVETISEYRGSWAQDRLERIRQWMENIFYWKGVQVIRWDTATNCWYDALAWARSQNQDSGEDTDLERWINPLTLMFCNVFSGTMSREVPKAVVKPQSADPSLQDAVTAKAAREAIGIIERKNQIRKLVRSIYEMLFLFGSYFRYTRPVIDAEMFGYDEVPQFEDMEIEVGPHYTCPNCGHETPATSADGMECPACGAFMGQESYYGAGEGNRTSLKMSGVKKVPKAGVKMSLISCLEMDVDPKAKGDNPLKMTPIASYDTEIDFGEACMMFPAFRDSIQPGAEVSTTPNASMEKLSRLNAVSAMGGMTADNSLMNPTYSLNWVQPMAYFKKKNWEFAQRMQAKFPDGLLLTMVGDVVVDIRAAKLTKEISHAALYTNQGVYCAALANIAVSFNARFNRAMWILDDWASRASTGINLANAGLVDTEKMSGKQLPAGTITPVPMRLNGQVIPMDQIIAHFDLPINAAMWGYPMMLMTFCELIIGIPRQIAGQGTQDDVETLGGQQLQLARAAATLKPYFENVKDESACASQNAFECLQALMKSGAVKEIQDVVEAQGGAFQNNNVKWNEMQGNVNFQADEDQDLPVSPEELRTAIQTMFTEMTKGNPAAAEWFGIPANQDLALSTMLPGSVLPDQAQQLKTEADIQAIMEQGAQIKMNDDGSKGTELPVHPSRSEDFPVAKQVVQRYMLEHFEIRVEQADRWILLDQYWGELLDAESAVASDTAQRQMKVQAAGTPPKPGPPPELKALAAQVQKAAADMIAWSERLAQIDPMLTKGSITGQVAAAKEVIETGFKTTELATGQQS